jgi:hypothetical protein
VSKVVKGVGRAISKVVDGVKNVAKSKVGKVLVGAALVYFGGAALMGAMGGATAGAAAGSGVMGTVTGAVSGGLSGAAAGISSAWSGLTGAASALAGGSGLQAAGSSLASGFTGASAAGASAIAPAATMAVPTTAPMAGAEAFSGATSTGLPTVAGDAANVLAAPPSKGLVGNFLGGLSPQGQAASIMVGGQLTGGLIQGYGMRQEQKRQEELAGDARARYNTNVGSRVWA